MEMHLEYTRFHLVYPLQLMEFDIKTLYLRNFLNIIDRDEVVEFSLCVDLHSNGYFNGFKYGR